MKLLIGADPEVFVQGPQGFVSAHIFGCGTKENPKKTKHGFIQVDGMALEFNTKPTDNPKKFIKNVRELLADLNVIVKKHDRLLSLRPVPTAHFMPEYLGTLPSQVLELGCNPDFNAYTEEMTTPPDPFVSFRTGSGHIHLGWTRIDETSSTHMRTCCSLVKELDYYLGLPSLGWDTDIERRDLYGKAGAFRPKKYGVEYRTLSNAWLSSDKTMTTVFNQAKKAFQRWSEGVENGALLHEEYGNFAQMAIDNNISDWGQQRPELAAIIYGE